MIHSRSIFMAFTLLAVLLTGCGADDNSDKNPSPDVPDTEDPGKPTDPTDPSPGLPDVAAPVSATAPDFIVRPYLQSPGTDTMSVMFETQDSAPQVWARPFDTKGEFLKVTATAVSADGLVYRAPLTGLTSNTLYEYYVLSANGADTQNVTQAFAFKTWPAITDNVSEARFIALSDTQLDTASNEEVLRNVVKDGFMTIECNAAQPETCAENIAGITVSGDVVQTGGNRDNWRSQFFGRMADITPYVPLITVPGNHDYYSNAELELYRTYMSPPDTGSVGYDKRWYYLDYLNLRLIGLDSYPISGAHGSFNIETLAVQRQWLRETLKDAELNSSQFVMGMFHHGCLSEMWNVGESIGSCELVTELEQFSQHTGAVTGHLFGHTHAYSRGQSMNVPHLWLNAASASGYIEPLNDEEHQKNQLRDYDTFEISRSEFGYSVLTYQFGSEPTLTLVRRKGGFDGDTGFAIIDQVVFQPGVESNVPHAVSGTGDADRSAITLGIQVALPENVHEVQWQLSESADFSATVFDVWGNHTRHTNLYYAEAAAVTGDKSFGFDAINTQQDADIFQLDLIALMEEQTVRPGADQYFRWHKRFSSQNTHTSSYDDYAGQPWPSLSLKPGSTYYWRARVRNNEMNWSEWSDNNQFRLNGTRTDNLLVNGDAETGDTSSWTLDAGLISAITASDNGGFAAADGNYYFAGRGFGHSTSAACCTDRQSQVVDLSTYHSEIDAGSVFVEFSVMATTWSGADQPEILLEFLDDSGQVINWSGDEPRSVSSAKSWQQVKIEGAVPAGTRSARVSIGGERKAGSDNDVYFDNLSLNLLY